MRLVFAVFRALALSCAGRRARGPGTRTTSSRRSGGKPRCVTQDRWTSPRRRAPGRSVSVKL